MRKHIRISIPSFIKVLYTLLVVMLGWVLFRCESSFAGLRYILNLFGIGAVRTGFTLQWYLSPKLIVVIIIAVLGCIPWKSALERKGNFNYVGLSYCCSILLLLISIIAIMGNTYNAFIYFKF